MKSKHIFLVSNILLGILLMSATFFSIINPTHAQTGTDNTSGGTDTSSGGTQSPSMDKVKLINPLGSGTDTIPKFLVKIIEILLVFAVPIIVLYIMYAGFLFVTARGNTEQISTARTALLWAIVGGVIVLGAEVIIKVIQGTVDGLK